MVPATDFLMDIWLGSCDNEFPLEVECDLASFYWARIFVFPSETSGEVWHVTL